MNKGIYQDSKGKWYISTKVKVGNTFKTATIRGYDSKKQASDDFNSAIENWKRNHHLIESNDIFENVRDNYFHYRSKVVSIRSVDRDRTQFNTYYNAVFTSQPISLVFDIKRLKNLYFEIENSKTFNQRKKHDLVNTFIDFAKFCYIQKIIDTNTYQDAIIVFQPIKFTKKVMKERKVIPISHLNALLSVIPNDHKDLVMFKVFVYTGVRISELLGLRVCSLNGNKLTIDHQYTPQGYLTDKLKTNNSYRKIPLNSELVDLLNEYITNLDLKENDRLFKVSHTDFKRKLHKYQETANTPLYQPHEYRHTKCFELAKKCENMNDVVYCAKIMGHSPIMFVNTYCNHLDENLENKFI